MAAPRLKPPHHRQADHAQTGYSSQGNPSSRTAAGGGDLLTFAALGGAGQGRSGPSKDDDSSGPSGGHDRYGPSGGDGRCGPSGGDADPLDVKGGSPRPRRWQWELHFSPGGGDRGSSGFSPPGGGGRCSSCSSPPGGGGRGSSGSSPPSFRDGNGSSPSGSWDCHGSTPSGSWDGNGPTQSSPSGGRDGISR
ncbi:UNVERIFIED_CONTAM: hypothetical protein FKN15_010496 [Acipenser sinensis]